MKVLVHYDATQTRAYGLWWVDQTSGSLRSLYSEDASPQAARGKIIVHGKENSEISNSEYFDMLASRLPYVESWVVYDSMGMSPQQMLRALEPAPPLAS